MKQSSEDLIAQLSAELAPVKPLARLRDTILAAVGISIPFYLGWVVAKGVRRQLGRGEMPEAEFLMVWGILLLLAAGGLIAGLSAAIPGREAARRLGRNLSLAGLGLSFIAMAYLVFFGGASLAESAGAALSCTIWSGLLAVPSALFVARFVVRGAAPQLSRSIALVCAGGIGMSAAVIHLTCSRAEPIHLLLGHGLAPVAGGLVLLIVVSTGLATGWHRSPSR